MVYLIAIAGGSGSGKSTLAYGLENTFPDLIEIVHFDDYQKMEENIPVHHGMKNWDHLDAINFEGLLRDLALLKKGQDVKIMTKSPKHNPQYNKQGRITHIMKSKKIIIVEGYMALTDERIRKIYDFTVFLDLPTDERMRRRTKFLNPQYAEKILLPMHEQYVESTKQYADVLVDVKKLNPKEVQELLLHELKERRVL